MFKQKLAELISRSLHESFPELSVTPFEIIVEFTKNRQNGDFTSNIALTIAKNLGRKPQEVATIIVNNLPKIEYIEQISIAGPGFINFFLKKQALQQVIPLILQQGNQFGHSDIGANKSILLEFVSSNPTGSLHVGHGRHAAFGDAIANLLSAVGYKIHKEYYVNDSGRQMDIVSLSLWLRYLELYDRSPIFPDNCYQGDYVVTIARSLQQQHGAAFDVPDAQLSIPEQGSTDPELYLDQLIAQAKFLLQEKYQVLSQFALQYLVRDMQEDLAEFGVYYDRWFAESELSDSHMLQQAVTKLQQEKQTYTKDNALWFKSTNFQDDKDRVLIRANGQATYFANDVAYHLTKFARGFDIAVNIIGSDHHGYVPRMQAAMQACNMDIKNLIFVELQSVSLHRGNERLSMSTREGNFITFRDLRQEVGNDATRFFYLNCKYQQHINFDLELAKKQSNDNPIYYVQYAHARISSIFRALTTKNMNYSSSLCDSDHLGLLDSSVELNLLHLLASYPEIILLGAQQYEPYYISNYLRKLASMFHTYYNSCQFLVEDLNLRQARLLLADATRQVLKNGLVILGIVASESM